MKTHLPADAVPLSPRASYIYVGRDGRDVVWSWYNHHRSLTERVFDVINNTPGRVGPALDPAIDDVRQYFLDWLNKDGYPIWPFWSHVQSWWNVRSRPNVLLLHFNRLKADLPGEIRRIASFLGMRIDEGLFPRVVEHCSFDYMKANASALSPSFDRAFHGGAGAFVYKGTNGRWRDVLLPEDIRAYERAATENLSADCVHWLAMGEGVC
jgi:aryl sulfotransferase